MQQAIDELRPCSLAELYSEHLLGQMSLFERVINENFEKLCALESSDTFKGKQEAESEIKVFIGHIAYARELLSKRIRKSKISNNLSLEITRNSEISYRNISVPKGVVGILLPYNFPAVVLGERLPYALASGNAVIVKPSEIATGSVSLIVRLAIEAFGVSRVLLAESTLEAGKFLVSSDKVNMISFTGSSEQGRKVSIECAKQLKSVSLELGGVNFAIVDDVAALEIAVENCVNGFLYHSGQCCISTRKILVRNHLLETFKIRFLEKVEERVGSGGVHRLTSLSTSYHAYMSQNHELDDVVRITNLNGPDIFIATENEENFNDEIFGPVVFLKPYDNSKQALDLLNSCNYGLGLQIFSLNKVFINSFINSVNVGRIWINSSLVSSPRLRIGGYGLSGNSWIGGDVALDDYSSWKAIVVEGQEF